MKLLVAALSLLLAAAATSGVSAFTPSSSSSFFTTPLSTSTTTTTTTTLFNTGVARNPNFAKLAGGYLFPEIGRRRAQYIDANPDQAARIISLGIGDTTQPIPSHILNGLVAGAQKLGTKEGYSGYGAEQGMAALREKIADKLYKGIIAPEEVFVSDGAKPGALLADLLAGLLACLFIE